MNSVIVHQTLIAWLWNRFTILALQIAGGAFVAVRVDAKSVLAARRIDCNLFMLAGTTLNGPIVVAVIVDGAFAIKEQTIFTSFKCQCAVSAQEELVTVIGVTVGEFTVWLGTDWLAQRNSSCCKEKICLKSCLRRVKTLL